MPSIQKTHLSSRQLLLLCFFISGMCGLIYEVAWLRVLSLVFGNTTFATSTILSSYMAGLGFGALYFGNRIDREEVHPLRLYAWLEGGVALYAFLTPFLWQLSEWVSIGFYRGLRPDYLPFNLFKFVLAFALLFPPTFLMGGTLPVVSKFLVREREETARYVGLLYALNTFGAVFGVLFSGFYALYTFGVWQTVYLAGLCNLAIFLVFRNFTEVTGKTVPPKPAGPVPVPKGPGRESSGPGLRPALTSRATLILLILFAFSGAVSMMYEIGWTRILAITLGSSVYAFSVMLATFLLGIALGSYLFSLWVRRRRAGLLFFSMMQWVTALFVLIGLNQFDDMPYRFVRIFAWSKGNMLLMDLGKFFLSALIMLVPTVMIGALFTCFIHVYRASVSLGKEVGTAYFANTVGTILGSVATGFWIIPAIGIQKTLMLGAGINAAVGGISFFLEPSNFRFRRLLTGAGMLAVLGTAFFMVEPWNASVIASDVAVKPGQTAGLTKDQFMKVFREREMLFYKEGLSSTVSVVRLKDNVSLAVNGKVDASNGDAFTQYLLGHLPMLLHPDPKKVLVIGLGSGSTMAAVAAYPVEKIDGVELEKAVVEASDFFKDLNRDVLKDPRVHMIVNDGRNFVLLHPEKYDVIISEPSNPWMAGVANLFSLEHFKIMRERLNPGGIVCQWLHAYSMSTEDLNMIIRTFTRGFKHVQLWNSYYPDLMLLGFNEEPVLDLAKIREKWESIPLIRDDLSPHGIANEKALFASFWLGDRTVRDISSRASIHSDNKPLLEFSAPRNLYRDTANENFAFLESVRDFKEMPRIEPPVLDPIDFKIEMARGLVFKKMYRSVKKLIDEIVQQETEAPSKKVELEGLLYFYLEDFKAAQASLLEAVNRNPQSAEAHYYLGETFRKEQNPGKARIEFQAAMDLEPRQVKYLQALADTLYEQREFPGALKLYEDILARTGRNFDVFSKVVAIYLEIRPTEEKIAILKQMVKDYPRYAPSYLSLGHLYEDGRMFSEALEAYRKFSEILPDEAGGYINLARVYDQLGRLREMVEAMKTAVKKDPSLADHPEVRKILQH